MKAEEKNSHPCMTVYQTLASFAGTQSTPEELHSWRAGVKINQTEKFPSGTGVREAIGKEIGVSGRQVRRWRAGPFLLSALLAEHRNRSTLAPIHAGIITGSIKKK